VDRLLAERGTAGAEKVLSREASESCDSVQSGTAGVCWVESAWSGEHNWSAARVRGATTRRVSREMESGLTHVGVSGVTRGGATCTGGAILGGEDKGMQGRGQGSSSSSRRAVGQQGVRASWWARDLGLWQRAAPAGRCRWTWVDVDVRETRRCCERTADGGKAPTETRRDGGRGRRACWRRACRGASRVGGCKGRG
jgi:hypothetical protein